jgi:16S rRNA (guanine527-N7)-methyltransferase
MRDPSEILKIEESISEFLPKDANSTDLAHVFYDFYLLLKTYNENVNLVADSSLDEFLFRHVLDSLSVIKAGDIVDLSGNKLLIDIGSGAGFPGFPLKILNPSLCLISIESTAKKADFQRKLTEYLKLNSLIIENDRAEVLARTDIRGTADLIVSRALATISTLIEISLPYLKKGGRAVFFKSFPCQEEIAAAANALNLCCGRQISVYNYQIRKTDPQRSLVIIEKTKETPVKYPRRNGIPFKRPL